jgi:predicted Zn-dependent protease
MAQSCYDPRSALQFWERMRSVDKASVPQLLSTHPSDETRITQLSEWMPRATGKYEDSDCANTARNGEYPYTLFKLYFINNLIAREFFSRGTAWG